MNSGLSYTSSQLRDQIQALQAQLAHRPPIEAIQELRKEYSNLELILQGTQRENERAMTELERSGQFRGHTPHRRTGTLTTPNRGKQREKLLERELEKLAGSNWQVRVQITLVLRQSGPSTVLTLLPLAPCPRALV